MIEEAIKKIKDEMEWNKDLYVQTIGNYLLKQIEINRDAAEKIVNGEKTIVKSLEVVKKEARKKAVNGVAMLEDREVYKLVREFYEFEAVQDMALKVEVEAVKPKVVEETRHKNFNVNLSDLLGRK